MAKAARYTTLFLRGTRFLLTEPGSLIHGALAKQPMLAVKRTVAAPQYFIGD